jgi:hypothetical protein
MRFLTKLSLYDFPYESATVLLAVRLSIVVKSDHRRVNYKMGDMTPIYVQVS